MNPKQIERLQRRGWKVSSVAEFLGLTPAEEALVESMVNASESTKGPNSSH